MNLVKLFEMQKVLDDRIVEEKGLEGQDLLDKKILALQVELGELANEWRGFKFWSKDQEPVADAPKMTRCKQCDIKHSENCDWCGGRGALMTGRKNPLLEEYADCLHFILSIGLEHEFNDFLPLAIEPVSMANITLQFTMLMRTDWEIYEEGDAGYYHEGLELFLSLGEMLGFTWEQIEQAYYDKNKENHERQSNGY